MDEAGVELGVAADVPERVDPVAVVQVGVAAEHLAHDVLAVGVEVLRESAGLADPVIAGELGEGRVEGGGARGDGGGGAGGGQAAGGVGVVGGRGVGDEDSRVSDLADDPFLNQGNVLVGRDFDGLAV